MVCDELDAMLHTYQLDMHGSTWNVNPWCVKWHDTTASLAQSRVAERAYQHGHGVVFNEQSRVQAVHAHLHKSSPSRKQTNSYHAQQISGL